MIGGTPIEQWPRGKKVRATGRNSVNLSANSGAKFVEEDARLRRSSTSSGSLSTISGSAESRHGSSDFPSKQFSLNTEQPPTHHLTARERPVHHQQLLTQPRLEKSNRRRQQPASSLVQNYQHGQGIHLQATGDSKRSSDAADTAGAWAPPLLGKIYASTTHGASSWGRSDFFSDEAVQSVEVSDDAARRLDRLLSTVPSPSRKFTNDIDSVNGLASQNHASTVGSSIKLFGHPINRYGDAASLQPSSRDALPLGPASLGGIAVPQPDKSKFVQQPSAPGQVAKYPSVQNYTNASNTMHPPYSKITRDLEVARLAENFSIDTTLQPKSIPIFLRGVRDKSLALLCALDVKIERTERVKDNAGVPSHTNYILSVRSSDHQGSQTWQIGRRYTEIRALHQAMKRQLPNTKFPKFPAKRYIGSSLSARFVEERREALQVYMRAVVKMPEAWSCQGQELMYFLEDAAKSLSLRVHYSELLDRVRELETAQQSREELLNRCAEVIRRQAGLLAAFHSSNQQPQRGTENFHASSKQPGSIDSTPNEHVPSPSPRVRAGTGPLWYSMALPEENSSHSRYRSHSDDRSSFSGGRSSVSSVPGNSRLSLGSFGKSTERGSSELRHLERLINDSEDTSKASESPAKGLPKEMRNETTGVVYKTQGHAGGPTLPNTKTTFAAEDKGSLNVTLRKYNGDAGFLHDTWSGGGGFGYGAHLGLIVGARADSTSHSKSQVPIGNLKRHSSLELSPTSIDYQSAQFGRGSGVPSTESIPTISLGNMNTTLKNPIQRVIKIPPEIIPRNAEPSDLDQRVDDLLALLRPSAASETHRMHVFGFVQAMIRKALGARVFRTSSSPLLTYLPDGAMFVNVFLCSGQQQNWFVKVNEMLCLATSVSAGDLTSSQGGATGRGSIDSNDQTLSGDSDVEGTLSPSISRNAESHQRDPHAKDSLDKTPQKLLRVSNVQFLVNHESHNGRSGDSFGKRSSVGTSAVGINNSSHCISCVISGVHVNIVADNVDVMIQSAMFEHVDELLCERYRSHQEARIKQQGHINESLRCVEDAKQGRHLFKRSVLLIKAWCTYESRGFSGPPVSGILSEYTILAMILHVFNLYHESIFSPIQALSRFLASFSAWDWKRYAVTIYGAVLVPGGMKLGPRPKDASSEPLISEDFLKFYREKYRMRHKHVASKSVNLDSPASPAESSSRVPAAQTTPMSGNRRKSMGVSAASPSHLCSGVMNVLDPLDSSANLTSHLTLHGVERLQDAFDYGARTILPVLQKLREDLDLSFRTWPHGKSDNILSKRNLFARFDSLFTNTWDRYRAGRRPDCTEPQDPSHQSGKRKQSLAPDKPDPLVTAGGSLKLREHIEYAMLLLRSEITVPSLLTLTKQILVDHWSLPVGEIGKQLQEATSNSGLSSIIKEKFGGLKRFLSGYPDVFLMSTTHPFNPQVYLRASLTPEEQDLVKNGVSVPGKQAPWISGVTNSTAGGSSKRSSRRKKRRNGRKKSVAGVNKSVDKPSEAPTLKATAVEFVPTKTE